MSSLFGGRRSGKKAANTPNYPTREEIINLYRKYYGIEPDEDTIRAHMGNAGGAAAIEKMLKDSLPKDQQPPEEQTHIPPELPFLERPYEGPVEPTLLWSESGLRPLGMAYWRNINQHYLDDNFKVFISINDEINILTVNKKTLQPVSSPRGLEIHHTGEGCWFSALEPNRLFIRIGNELRAYDIRNGSYNVAFRLNADENVWQAHGDYYDTKFSCTVKDLNWYFKEWYAAGKRFAFKGEPDECQIDKSGEYLLTKEGISENNIYHIDSGHYDNVSDYSGALGHSDNGFKCAIGEFDKSDFAGDVHLLPFDNIDKHRMLYSTGIWNMGYFSFGNAKPQKALENSYGLVTTPKDIRQIKLDGSGSVRKICEIYSPNEPYENRVKANICPEGEFAVFTMGSPLKLYVVRIPSW